MEVFNAPVSFRRLKADFLGQEWDTLFEYPLFTDAHMIGEISEGFGPYQLINTVTLVPGRPSLILRVKTTSQRESPQMDKTQDDHYHGGSEAEEIAALLSLCLGIRVKAGGATRVFSKGGDPLGRPIGWDGFEDPSFITVRSKSLTGLILPSSIGDHSLQNADVLLSFPLLSNKNAIALIRAARMYQEAVWIIESFPELAWIMLTSAVETVAAKWRPSKETSLERMQASRPDLESILRQQGGDEFVSQVAEQIAPYMGATKTFIDFIITFLPPAPSVRPPTFAQVAWETSAMKKTLNQIYDCRSRALHSGRPFPAPMCQPPRYFGENGEPEEKPTGSAQSIRGAVWVAKDIPILLHTFEYIARNSILNWWKSASQEA